MSRKGGQNKGKDGGALLAPHGGTVSERGDGKLSLGDIPGHENDQLVVVGAEPRQNGDDIVSRAVTTSGEAQQPLVLHAQIVHGSASSLVSLPTGSVETSPEWLKKNIGNGGFDIQSSHDELDGHRASKTDKGIGDFFVVPDASDGDVRVLGSGLDTGVDSVSMEASSRCVNENLDSMSVELDAQLPRQDEQLTPCDLSLSRTITNTLVTSTMPRGTNSARVKGSTLVTDISNPKPLPDKKLFNSDSDSSDEEDLGLLEFRDLPPSSNKNNTLLTPQELENIPDECLNLEESLDTSVEDIVKKMWSNSNNISDLATSTGVSILSESETNKLNSVDLLSTSCTSPASETPITEQRAVTPAVSESNVTSLSSPPVVAYNSSANVVLPGPVLSMSQAGATCVKTTPEVSNTSNSSLPANCTLATIYISTDKGANSTQIRVNTGNGQQLYHLNTAALTGAPPMATVVQNVAPPAVNTPSSHPQGEAVTPPTDCLTGYLLLPVGQSDSNGILMSVPLGSVTQASAHNDEHVLEPSEILPGQAYDSSKKIWKCPEDGCEKAFKKQSKLRIHLMRHTGERPFKCSRAGCGWAFTTAYKLRRHEESHEGRKDYICDIDGCNRKFTTIYNLNSHRRLHDRPCNEICMEPGCGQRFHTKRKLDLHMKNHVGAEKNYKCPVEGCNKVFFSPNCMGSHARVHQQERDDLTCKFEGCGKTFEKMCRLKQHMRSHTGEKPYICSHEGCGWAFTTASKLTRHMNKHTGERRWECPIEGCGKAFMRAEHLKGHVVTHSGARPFLCPVEGCNSRFTAKSSLYVHLKKHDHSGEKIVYFCPMEGCEKKYATKSCLRNHITKHYSTSVSVGDQAHFDLVPLLAGDDLPEGSLDNFPTPQTDTGTTPVSAVNINTSMPPSLLGSSDPVLISPSDYIATGVDQPVMTAASFPSDGLAHQLSSNMVTQFIVANDLQSPGVFSGALLGVPPATMMVPGSPVTLCTNCSSPVIACTCNQSPETPTVPANNNNKHKTKISIGKGAASRITQENTSGSARTDYRSNHLLSDRAKKRRLMLKDKIDLPTLPVPASVVSSQNLASLSSDVMKSSTPGFRASEVMNSQGITYRDPDTGTTYVQTQLLQDDPPNPELYPDDTSLTSELATLHDTSTSDVTGTQFTGTTINLQDLE